MLQYIFRTLCIGQVGTAIQEMENSFPDCGTTSMTRGTLLKKRLFVFRDRREWNIS